MWIKEPDSSNPPQNGVFEVGFVFKQDKVYIMDNHLAAGWCWLNEVDIESKYNFFHIDRHYDLLDNNPTTFLKSIKKSDVDTLDKYISLKVFFAALNDSSQVFRFDNYIMNMIHRWPNFFMMNIFATHDDGDIAKGINIDYYPALTSLPSDLAYQIQQKSENKWILNLDLDYFFTDSSSTEYFQFLTNDYIDLICDDILLVYDQISVITIAMSPYFCNGWDNSKAVLDRICSKLNIKIDFPQNFRVD